MFVYLKYYIRLFLDSWVYHHHYNYDYDYHHHLNTNALLLFIYLFFLHVWLLINSLLFGYDHNELVLFHFLNNKLDFRSTLYLSCKFIEVSCETDSMTEFAISAASLRFPISIDFWNKLSFASRRFVIKSVLTFWYGLICKSQKRASITNLLLIGTKRNWNILTSFHARY